MLAAFHHANMGSWKDTLTIAFLITVVTAVVTTVQVLLAWATTTIVLKGYNVSAGDGWGTSESDWDTISAAVTLLLATYLPLALSKYSEVLSAFHMVIKRAREIMRIQPDAGTKLPTPEQKSTANQLIVQVCDSLLKNDHVDVNAKLASLYNNLDPNNEPQMDRLSNFEDSLIELHNKRKYQVPKEYTHVLLAVLVIFSESSSRTPSKPPHRFHALIDVGLIGFINNLIFAAGYVISRVFTIEQSDEFRLLKKQLVSSRKQDGFYNDMYPPLAMQKEQRTGWYIINLK